MTENANPPPEAAGHANWSRTRKAVIVLLLLAVPLGIYLHRRSPDYYDRTRIDLLEASRQLDIYHHDMELLVEEYRHAADALRTSIGWLMQAAALDPADMSQINKIATELKHWEDLARTGTLSPAELHERYEELAGRVQGLIDKRTKLNTGG